MKRFLAPVLTALLIVGVGYALYVSSREAAVVTVRGVIGSEKEEFFRDPRVIAALKADGLSVEFVKSGSRDIATKFDLTTYDFAFPAGMPAAEKIRRDRNIAKFYTAFFSPMTIASWTRIVQILEANKIVEKRDSAYYIIDMHRLLELVKARKRWNELPSSQSFPSNLAILINSTNARSSNSGAMYLSLASYIHNHANIVTSEEQITPIMNELAQLFLRQGYTPESSETPFEDYLSQGIGKSPLVLIYEAQFLRAKSQPNSPITDDMKLLYPEPTVFSKHVLVPLSRAGERLGEALTTNLELKRLAVEHGFRTDKRDDFREFVKRHKLAVPDDLVNVVEMPSYEILERMIVHVEDSYKTGGK